MLIRADSWQAVGREGWTWSHFSPREMACHHCGRLVIDDALLTLLETMRLMLGRPLPVTSGYRCPEWNERVARTGRDGPHTTGQAADIRIHGGDALSLIRVATGLGVRGLGVQQRGEYSGRIVHVDLCEDGPGRPRPWVWTY